MNVKKSLDEYLEFDSNELFNKTDYLVVFGGAIRDIVAGDENHIKDIDIMCLPKSKRIAHDILLSEGYQKYELFTPDMFLLYANIKCIFEPKTYVKGDKIVQLITPYVRKGKPNNLNDVKNNFFEILTNVDLSSSGLVYDGEEIYESIRSSFPLCKSKKYFTISNSKMYNPDRINIRKYNLNDKGWKEIHLHLNDIKVLRALKILSLRSSYPQINILKEKLEGKKINIIKNYNDINFD